MSERPSVWVLHKSASEAHNTPDWLTDWPTADTLRRQTCTTRPHQSAAHTPIIPPERKTSINYPANETNPFSWWSVTSSRHRDEWRSRCHLYPVTKQYLSRTQREDWQEGWRAIYKDACQHSVCERGGRLGPPKCWKETFLIVQFRLFQAFISCICSS